MAFDINSGQSGGRQQRGKNTKTALGNKHVIVPDGQLKSQIFQQRVIDASAKRYKNGLNEPVVGI